MQLIDFCYNTKNTNFIEKTKYSCIDCGCPKWLLLVSRYIIFHVLQFLSFYSWLAVNNYFLTLFRNVLLLSVILLLVLLFRLFLYLFACRSAGKNSSCYSCRMESPVTGNYRCFLARSLIVIVGYVNLRYTCYKSILTCHNVRWIEETFLVLLVKVSYTKYIRLVSLFSFLYQPH